MTLLENLEILSDKKKRILEHAQLDDVRSIIGERERANLVVRFEWNFLCIA